MTVCIGYHTGSSILLGSDTQAEVGNSKYNCANDKVFEWGHFAIALSGCIRHASLITDDPDSIFGGDPSAHDVATRIKMAIEEDAGELDAADGLKLIEFEALLVNKRDLRMFLIDGSFGVMEIFPESFFAVGTGADHAIGAMAALLAWSDTSDPQQIVLCALEACIDHARGCGGEGIVLTYTNTVN